MPALVRRRKTLKELHLRATMAMSPVLATCLGEVQMSDKGDSRGKAEARFAKAQRTTDAAKSETDAKQKAMREKTARLKSQRLAKEESDREAAAAQKPAPKKKRSG